MPILTLSAALVAAATPHNRQPGLLPPQGLWRGATLDNRYGGIGEFESDYGVPLHLFRGFMRKGKTAFSDSEAAFIAGGGIYFYSTQPSNWSKYGSGAEDAEIAAYADAVAGVAPAQVFVAPGFEPDGHVNPESTKDYHGTPSEYRTMYQRYRTVFKNRNVTNAVFVLDYSNGVHKNQTLLEELYPGDGLVDWVFHNMFQSKTGKKGNCTEMALANYNALKAFSSFSSLPWGLGAWGTRNATFGPVEKAIPDADRKECLEQMTALLAQSGPGGSLTPRYRAGIYFNSLQSLISPRKSVPCSYLELAPAQTAMFKVKQFTVNDK
eukprot:Hpha_TRINITY_DN8964_c0_g1::TRINITY_DN8964_c0_g1_i1::g.81003::m.81003